MISHDTEAALARLIRFLSIEGVTGREARIGAEIMQALGEAGVAPAAMGLDDANARIPLPTETGNLIARIPGRGALAGAQPVLFMTHMDTVPLCAGAKPVLQGTKIVNGAHAALGGDNRNGCAILVTLAAELAKQRLDHPPLTLAFCVREESGLWGARYIDTRRLGPVAMGFNFDGRVPFEISIGALGAEYWFVDIVGRASHAGVAPERGISATMILAVAMAKVRAGGWFGRVVKGERIGTSNIGLVSGKGGGTAGDATNVVTDFVHAEGECRSHDEAFFKEITAAYASAFAAAAAEVRNSEGKAGTAKFTSETRYYPFKLDESAAVVARARAGVMAVGLAPSLRLANGGLDANWLVRHGVPTVTFGVGQNEPHTVDEWIDVSAYQDACRLALALATQH